MGEITTRRRGARGAAAMVAAGAVLLGAWAVLRAVGRPDAERAVATVGAPALDEAAAQAEAERIVAEIERRGAIAQEAAVARVRAVFAGARSAAPGFVEDMTSWGARARIAGLAARDRWRAARRSMGLDEAGEPPRSLVEGYVAERFGAAVLAPGEIERAAGESLASLAEDLDAARASAWAASALPLPSSMMGEREERGVAVFGPSAARADNALGAAALRARESTSEGVAALVAGGFAGAVGEQVAAQAAVRLAASLAGSAAASGAGAGAAGGALGGPVGFAIGLTGGVAAGAAVDWWMTDRFRDRLGAEIGAAIDEAERATIDGAGNAAGESPMKGERAVGVRAVAARLVRERAAAARREVDEAVGRARGAGR